MSQPIIDQGGHFVFLIGPKNTKLCELVGYGLTSHSAIFQLYSDGTVVQFPNFDLLPGTQRHGQLGVFSVPSLPRHGHQDVRVLAIRGPTRGEGMPGIEPGSSDPQSSPLHMYLYAIAEGSKFVEETEILLPVKFR